MTYIKYQSSLELYQIDEPISSITFQVMTLIFILVSKKTVIFKLSLSLTLVFEEPIEYQEQGFFVLNALPDSKVLTRN